MDSNLQQSQEGECFRFSPFFLPFLPVLYIIVMVQKEKE